MAFTRYVWFVLGVATAHRLLTWVIACLGFLVGMEGFEGGGGEPVFSMFHIAAILDLPVSLLDSMGKGHSISLRESGAKSLALFRDDRWPWQLAWSLVVGGIVASVAHRARRRKVVCASAGLKAKS